ncbi:hypothetical protein AV530_015292 [Patagioenas fasciata monilis]|uniref:Uncharacterized protein n=1 Tax=Patagioenas fasciata monilis TaxID=372326 RepID=A0A1V4K1M3_PATFA|nr:hypothetical protein AV530_015292 [Patagioenas fasciata monilis]
MCRLRRPQKSLHLFLAGAINTDDLLSAHLRRTRAQGHLRSPWKRQDLLTIFFSLMHVKDFWQAEGHLSQGQHMVYGNTLQPGCHNGSNSLAGGLRHQD